MKILLIGNYQPDQQESMQRFANMLQIGLIELGHKVRLIRPEPFFGKIKLSAGGLGKWLGYIDKFLIFPRRELRQAASWADVVHICDHSNAVYTKYLQNVPHLVTCNDLLAIQSSLGEIKENSTNWTGQQLQKMILSGLKRSHRVACISEQTKRDLLRLAEVDFRMVSVIYMGLNYPYAPMEQAEAGKRLNSLGISSNSRFILHVGGNQWYKNRLGVLSIFNYLRQQIDLSDLYLVMAGKPFTNQMRQFVHKNALEKQVIELVAVDNKDLHALYSSAIALLFPSLKEGFGWPIAEAQACGCPVFTSNRAPMTEVGGDAAIYINPDSIEEAAREIAKNLPNTTKIKNAGMINVEQFSTQKMLNSYITLYNKLCK